MKNPVDGNGWSRKREAATTVPCRLCGQALTMHRGCLAVTLRCGSCGASFPLAEAAGQMTEDLEEELAFVPMDRI